MTEELKTYFNRCLDGMAGCTKSSTAHGVNHVANSGHPIIRIFWSLAFAAGTAIFLFHFYTLLDRFWSNPVSIVVNYRVVEFEFPDVTFCPLLPFSIRVLEQRKQLHLLSGATDLADLEKLVESARLPLRNFILHCKFYDMPCNVSGHFMVVEDPRYLNCYTYKPYNRKPRSSVPQDALSVTLFSENLHPHKINQSVNVKLPSAWQSAGVRVVVHPPDTRPHPEVRGLDVSPGTSAMIGLSISRILQIKDCEHRSVVAVCDPHNQTEIKSFNFTKEDCYAEQIQERMLSHCNCLSSLFQLPAKFCKDNSTGGTRYTRLCSSDPELKKCHTRLANEINQNFGDIISKCPYLCMETHWHSSMHATAWPSEFSETQVVQIFGKVEEELKKEGQETFLGEYTIERHGDNVDMLKKNLLHVTVYPNALAGNEEQQEPAYPLMSLLGEVGGILGLWLGCSVLTFFEPVELLLHAITPFCMRQVAAIQQKSEQLRAAVETRTTAFRTAMDQHTAVFRTTNRGHHPPREAEKAGVRQSQSTIIDLGQTDACAAGTCGDEEAHGNTDILNDPKGAQLLQEACCEVPHDTVRVPLVSAETDASLPDELIEDGKPKDV